MQDYNSYEQGFLAGSKYERRKSGNLIKTLRKALWFAVEVAGVLFIFKGCFG